MEKLYIIYDTREEKNIFSETQSFVGTKNLNTTMCIVQS